MMATIDRLQVTIFSKPQPDRMNYRYIITSGAFSHIAFRHKGSFKRWLNERGLKLDRQVWKFKGQRTFNISGSYRTVMMIDIEAFDRIAAPTSKILSNGSWTLCKIVQSDGVIEIVHLNPNVNRAVFDYRKTAATHG